MDITLRVLVFKILLPHPGWHLRADGEPDERSPTVWTSRIRVADPRVAARREKQYQLRIVDRSLDIPPCHTQASPERVKQHEHTQTPMTQPDKDHDDGSETKPAESRPCCMADKAHRPLNHLCVGRSNPATSPT